MPEQLNLILICEANLTKPYKQAFIWLAKVMTNLRSRETSEFISLSKKWN